jgi:hypothetical protein
MRNLDGLTKLAAAVLFAVLWSSDAWPGPADTTARALPAAWKDADPGMAKVAEVIASAFASGMSWAGTIQGHPVYCPPPNAPLTANQLMTVLDSFATDHPDAVDKDIWLRALSQLDPRVPLHARLNELLRPSETICGDGKLNQARDSPYRVEVGSCPR